ncbi:type VI secretion system contractile sheath large subunit [Mesorhizobium sp. BAC0120]|uniref:type VI secretion system contractile sheath large subunit n=1 Tax=Mesorhizobium sp. BAC0120 TaxID=3090670 RepID=UPI00298C3EAC|nr:type VI secretion system contractile sheath large subunit [Mesorhizobium sp. BAC0120]MDW6025447.1 type VI secretion system contractile sheath large subunit [Mesorhizobium sp. BAC0120]
MATELQQEKTASAEAAFQDADEFASLLKQSFKPRSERAATEVDNAISTLVQQALADTSIIKEDVLDTIQDMIARLDEKLSDQMNAIMHAPEFQGIESAWRGLSYLVYNSETDATLKLKVMNVSKNELYRDLRNYPDAKWDQSPLFKKLYEAEFGQLGGQPYGCLVGDYYFDQSAVDVRLLRDLGKVAAAAHCPFISGAAPTLLGMDSWTELSNPRDLSKIFETPDYAGWKSLRDSENSRYVALCMPRVLAREPFGAKSIPVEEFDFEEETDGHKGGKYAWMNAAYAMAANINRAYKEWGWTVRIRGVQSGGEVINLPTHTFPTDDGDIDLKCPTEIAISDRREAELSKSGLLPLIHRKNTDKAAFIGAQSLYKPKKYDNVDATASDNISSRIPYMFAVSRFAHYLKCMVRDQIGETKEAPDLEKWLTKWIVQYVDGDPRNSTTEIKAKKPLAAAKVEVFPDEENPGYYSARFFLRPHFQLEGMDIGMSLVSRLPGQQNK